MNLESQSRLYMPAINRITVIILVLLSAGYARTYQVRYVETSHFLDDYSLLKDGEDGDALLSFWKEGINWAGYKKIILEPVIASKLPDSDLNDMTHAENHRLKELFEYRMREALKKNFKLVAHPGPDTLRLQFAITDAESSILPSTLRLAPCHCLKDWRQALNLMWAKPVSREKSPIHKQVNY
ncbi:MAG: DUF3313 domain-containing protein [Methylobacter sp.]|nr:DUF3313 domain-containing protein [Methylobacter sp.]